MPNPVQFLLLFMVVAAAIGIANRDELKREWEIEGPPEYILAPDSFTNAAVTAKSFIVFDVMTGRVFGERAADDTYEMASVTKLITAYTALATSSVDASTTVTWRAVATDGRAGNLAAGKKYGVRELLFPLLLESSNDAAEAIVEANGRANFIAMMNEEAHMIGMASTTVTDPSGLGRGNVSTAHDLMTLVRYLHDSNRHIFDITTLSSYVGTRQMWRNSDPLASSEGFVGGKHGYTDTAGRTIALVVEEQFHDIGTARPIGIVLLDSADLMGDVAKLREEFHRSVSLGYR